MNSSVFFNELRLSRGMLIGWTLAVMALALVYMSVFPAFSNDAGAVRDLLKTMPPSVTNAFKLDVDTLLSFLGYYSFTMTMLSLLGGFAAVGLGLSIFSREEQSKTTDFLLSKPVRRWEVFVAKFLAGILQLVVLVAVFTLAVYALSLLFDVGEYDLGRFLWLQMVYFVVLLWLYVFGAMLTQLIQVRSVVATTLGTVFTFFVLGFIGALLDEDKFRYISPFKAVDVMEVAGGKHVNFSYICLLVVVGLICIVYAYYRYTKKDVRSVS